MAMSIAAQNRCSTEMAFMRKKFGTNNITRVDATPKMTSPIPYVIEVEGIALTVWLYSSKFRRPQQCTDAWTLETVLDGWFIYSRCMPPNPAGLVALIKEAEAASS